MVGKAPSKVQNTQVIVLSTVFVHSQTSLWLECPYLVVHEQMLKSLCRLKLSDGDLYTGSGLWSTWPWPPSTRPWPFGTNMDVYVPAGFPQILDWSGLACPSLWEDALWRVTAGCPVHWWLSGEFTPKSDQCQISPAASPEILRHTVWRTWLFIGSHSEMIILPILTTSLIHFSLKDWEKYVLNLVSKRVKINFRDGPKFKKYNYLSSE